MGEGGGGTRYGYVAGRVLEARDPSGLYVEYPAVPFQDPCGGLDTCYQNGIYIDGVYASGWDTGMLSWGGIETINGVKVRGDRENAAEKLCRRAAGSAAFKEIAGAVRDLSEAAGAPNLHNERQETGFSREFGTWVGPNFETIDAMRPGSSGGQPVFGGMGEMLDNPSRPAGAAYFIHSHQGDTGLSPADERGGGDLGIARGASITLFAVGPKTISVFVPDQGAGTTATCGYKR